MRSARIPHPPRDSRPPGRPPRAVPKRWPASMRAVSALAVASLMSLGVAAFSPVASAAVRHDGAASTHAATPKPATRVVPPAHGVTGTYPSKHACAKVTKDGFATCFSLVRVGTARHIGLFKGDTTPA